MSGENANAVITVCAEQVIKRLLDAIGRELGYLFSYRTNIKNLKNQVVQLENLKEDVVIFLNEQSWNNAERTKASAGWLKEVEEVVLAAKAVEDKDKLRVWCVNLKNNRYRQSKKSTKVVAEIQKILNKAPKTDAIHQAPPPAMLPGAAANDAAKDFISRTEIIDKVMEALSDEKINVIGICGLGGIGKTTILHEVRERARTQFDAVPMTTVSQVTNVFEIQKNLAGTLGLKSIQEVNDIIPRADLLHKRLTNGSRNLILLDDIWSEIKLNEIGIPVGGMTRCKVVLASRYETVCTSMKSQKTIPVDVLPKEEAWHMFKNAAGDCIEKEKVEEIAKEIADKCGGLPIALVTLAGALFNKKKSSWEDARRLLRQSSATRLPELLNKEVYLPIMVSYKLLATHDLLEAQQLLLICCQHGEDVEIEVEKLARYCLALELFKGVDKLGEARNRTYKLIEDLKGYFLLQAVPCNEEGMCEKVKMHDAVREICLSIVFKVQEEREGVYMHIMSKHSGFGHELGTNNVVDYPKLKLLMVADYYDGVVHNIEQMEELRVLEIGESNSDLYLQPELQVLKNLRMLCIENQHSLSEDIVAAIGSLSSLEILFWRSEIYSFPHQIGQLSNLKLLDMRSLNNEDLFPSGILPQLNKLEMLCMGNYGLLGIGVDKDIENGESYGRITELDSLPDLTTLQIKLGDPSVLLDLECFCFENLETFLFTMKRKSFLIVSSLLVGKSIKLIGEVGMNWVNEVKIQRLVRSTLTLRLKNNDDWTDPLILKKFLSLETLKLEECDQLEYIIPDGSLTKLRILKLKYMSNIRRVWMGPIDPLSCVNLRQILLNGCKAMEVLFPHTIAKCLVQLQKLTIWWCPKLEGIFSKGDLGTTCTSATEIRKEPLNDFIVHLPKLRVLFLDDLRELKGFYNVNIDDDGKVLQHLINPRIIMLPSLEMLTCRSLHHMKQIVGGGVLEHSKLVACNWLQNLQHVDVYNCDSLETLFDFEGLHFMRENAQVLALGGLKYIQLKELPKLEHLFWQIPHGILSFQNLETLKVDGCGSLGYLISSSMAHMLVNLKILVIEDCKSMKEVIKMDEDFDVKKILFRVLSSVMLFDLENLASFCSDVHQSIEFPLIEEVVIYGCPKMKTFRCGHLTTKKLQEVNPNDENILVSNVKIEDGKVIRPLFNPQVTMLPSLENLRCRGLHHIKQIVGGGVLEHSKLVACNWLQNLRYVEVGDFDSLETLFDFDGLHFMEENAQVFTLGALKDIELEKLPKLEHLFWQIPHGILSFQNLETLTVNGCGSLGYLISSSMAHMLVNLQILVVEDCKSMKEVIKMDEEYGVKKILFRFLSRVKLQDLENLSSFCSDDRQSIELPSLKEMSIYDCAEMKTFCCGHLTTEKLKDVYLDDGNILVSNGDLNDTLRQFNKMVHGISIDIEERDDPERGVTDKSADECSTDEGMPMKASIPLSILTSPNASLTPNVVSDNNGSIAKSSSPDLRKDALPPLIECVPSAPTEQSVHTSNDSTVQPQADNALSDMSSLRQDESDSNSSIPLERSMPKKAFMPLSVVASPNASLTSDIVSPPPVSENNEDFVNSSSSTDLRRVALSPVVEFVPPASMEQSVRSSDSLVQPIADHKELIVRSFSIPDDDWKKSMTLIEGVYVKAKLKTTFEEILAANPNFFSGFRLKTAKMKSEALESAICSLQILRQHTALTISSEQLAYIKDSLDDMETSGLDTAWLKRGYQRAILVIKEQKVVSAAEELAMLEREETEDEGVFEMARAKLQASKARRVAFKAEYDALLQELESGKDLFGRGFELETSLGDGLLD